MVLAPVAVTAPVGVELVVTVQSVALPLVATIT
jgi:hypothetical protein